MAEELKSPSPGPDWPVVIVAIRAAKSVQILVEEGKLTEEEAEDILDRLGNIIEAEAGWLT